MYVYINSKILYRLDVSYVDRLVQFCVAACDIGIVLDKAPAELRVPRLENLQLLSRLVKGFAQVD